MLLNYNIFIIFADYGLGGGFQLLETASFLNGLPPDMFGKSHQ